MNNIDQILDALYEAKKFLREARRAAVGTKEFRDLRIQLMEVTDKINDIEDYLEKLAEME